MTAGNLFLLLSLSALVSCQTVSIKNKIPHTSLERPDHVDAQAEGETYVIATQGRYSSRAAEEIFSWGGNNIDATFWPFSSQALDSQS